jgi:hypothetical protein
LNEAESVLECLVTAYRLAPSICALAWLADEKGDNVRALELIAPLAWDELSALDQRIVKCITPSSISPKELRLTLLPEERKRFAVYANTINVSDPESE